jgi:pilus assembly protein CpaF
MSRLETLVLMAGMDLPLPVIRRQIAGAVNLIIQVSRLKDGSRKVVQITELQGMEGDQITLQDLFVYKTPGQTGLSYSHAGGGQLEPTGFRPNFVDQLEEFGFKLGGKMFGAGQKFNK